MNKVALLKAQQNFLDHHPGGFSHPDMEAMGKKFKMQQHIEFAQGKFNKSNFKDALAIVDAMATLVSRSAMVSMFEKPKFKSAVSNLSSKQKTDWSNALFELLHGNQQKGFESLVANLTEYKLAKWTLVSIFGAYYSPQKEVYVKPSTTKLIIEKLDINLSYKPTPTWDFYRNFRKELLAMRKIAKDVNAPNNAAFSGFLMMHLGG